MIYGLVALAIIIGTLMPLQAGLNAELTRILKHPYLGAFISLTSGAIAVLILVLIKGIGMAEFKKMGEVSPHLYLGGLLGAIFVGSSLFFIPKMGATPMIAAFITGQLLGSVLIDHYGLLGLTVTPVSLTRILGVILLFAGLFLVIKKNA
jgi:bacterial/archaeal transporter family-2 protein